MREFTGRVGLSLSDMTCRSCSKMLLLIVLCVSFTNALAPHQNVTSNTGVENESRGDLEKNNVVPSAYRIHITPHYSSNITDTTEFSGYVEIDVYISASTREFLFHAGEEVNVIDMTIENSVKTYKPTFTRNGEVMTSKTSSLAKGYYMISIHFTGLFQREFNGFYKSTYKKNDTEDGVLFTTQFQATHARKAFPCFDEPQWKAKFLLKIDVPPYFNALSNTPINASVLRDDSSLITITFQETVQMSTYLVAFIVYEASSYTYIQSNLTEDISIKTWARKDAIDNQLAAYSNEVTPLILLELENYTGIPYLRENMKKIDQAAIPHFSAGAMENWGLMTYRETRLLFSETADTEATRKRVAAVIAHELAHQWFGNLVTTKWWDTTWLNEGFARYLQYLILSRVYPEWRMMEQLLVDQQISVFALDAVDTAKHLSHDVATPQDIKGQFGTITYSKGASFLRMISNAIGEENFENALHDYLESNKYQSVTPKHLYAKLEEMTPEDRKPSGGLEKALETWTQKPGFPVVKVLRDNGNINISQERFFADGPKNSNTTYHIPITWSNRNGTEHFNWFTQEFSTQRDFFEDIDALEDWLLIKSRGYYRVMYDEGNLISLWWTMARKTRDEIPAVDRAQLFDDALALAAAGYLPYREAKYMMLCFRGETDVLPWAAVAGELNKLDSRLGGVDYHGVLYRFVRNATESIYKKLEGFSNSGSFIELVHRPTILRMACRAGNEDCIENAVSLLKNHQQNGEALDPNLRSVIYCYGIMNGDADMWDHLWNTFKDSTDETERTSAITALGCAKDRATLKTFLRNMCAETNDEEAMKAFSASVSHPAGIDITLDFILEQLPDSGLQNLGVTNDTAKNILRTVASHIYSEAQYKEFKRGLEEQFQRGTLPASLVDELETVMEKNVAWVTKYSDDALEALASATPGKEYVTPPTTTSKPSQGHYFTLQVQVLAMAFLFLILAY